MCIQSWDLIGAKLNLQVETPGHRVMWKPAGSLAPPPALQPESLLAPRSLWTCDQDITEETEIQRASLNWAWKYFNLFKPFFKIMNGLKYYSPNLLLWILKYSGFRTRKSSLENLFAMAGVPQWTEHWPANWKVTSCNPSQGTCMGCMPCPQLKAWER